MKIKIKKEFDEEMEYVLTETGFELWNASCTLRMTCNPTEKRFAVCPYNNPLSPVKEFATLQGAVNYMQKSDE